MCAVAEQSVQTFTGCLEESERHGKCTRSYFVQKPSAGCVCTYKEKGDEMRVSHFTWGFFLWAVSHWSRRCLRQSCTGSQMGQRLVCSTLIKSNVFLCGRCSQIPPYVKFSFHYRLLKANKWMKRHVVSFRQAVWEGAMLAGLTWCVAFFSCCCENWLKTRFLSHPRKLFCCCWV